MPFQPIGDRTPLGVNMENAEAFRQKRRDDLAAGRRGPGGVMLAPSWDAFGGAMMRQDEDAAAEGKRSNFDLSGIGTTLSPGIGTMPTALTSLQRRARGPAADDDADPTDYQMRRAELDRTLHDNAARTEAQHYATTDLERAHDPGIVDYEEQQARKKAAEDQQAKDEIEGASFRRTEPTRILRERETLMNAREMAPFNPALQKSASAMAIAYDKNQMERDKATITANGKESAAGKSALARMVSGLAMSGASQDEIVSHVNSALGDIGATVPAATQEPAKKGWFDWLHMPGADRPAPAPAPQVPSPVGALNRAAGAGPQGALKQLPPEWDFNLITDKFGGDVAKADEWLRVNGYRR